VTSASACQFGFDGPLGVLLCPVTQLVEFRVHAGRNRASVNQGQRRLLDQRRLNPRRHIVERIQPHRQLPPMREIVDHIAAADDQYAFAAKWGECLAQCEMPGGRQAAQPRLQTAPPTVVAVLLQKRQLVIEVLPAALSLLMAPPSEAELPLNLQFRLVFAFIPRF